jgi:hypothetical protein
MPKKTRTEFPEKKVKYFLFQIRIQRGQITKIHQFSFRGQKERRLNLFVGVIRKKT